MADFNNKRLLKKTAQANNLEFFVFLPNDLTDITAINGNVIFREAMVAKDTGNACFQEKQYDAAINHYNKAIEILERIDQKQDPKLYAIALSICYQNRASVKAYKKNYVDSIFDATKAIELNEHYSKAYFRRSKNYYDQKKYYLALQDVVQACILERFKNKTYIAMVVDIVARIDLDLIETQWKMAYDEMGTAELYCDHCLIQQINFVKNCGILDQIIVPIPNNEPATGYIRAMVGINESNIDKIMAGCKEEEAKNGKYLAQSYILRAYMNSVVLTSPSNTAQEWPKDLQRLNGIISHAKTPENIQFNAKLCRANLYHRKHLFNDANCDLKSLEQKYGNTSHFYIIKSGALLQLAGTFNHFFEALKKCCELLPNVYELQLHKVMVESNRKSNPIDYATHAKSELGRLINRFPKEIGPRMCLAAIHTEMNEKNEAKKLLEKAKRDLPDSLDEMSSAYGSLVPRHPSCVAYFKRSLTINKDDPNALEGLLDYFGSTTHEYAKALEVSTKALFSFLKTDDFKDMFQHRQALLKRIVRQNFWDKL